MSKLTFLRPLDAIAQVPRCPKCSSHNGERIKSGWSSDARYKCGACQEEYEINWAPETIAQKLGLGEK